MEALCARSEVDRNVLLVFFTIKAIALGHQP